MKQLIHSDHAPQAIGIYSQAIKVSTTVYLSGQLPLDVKTMSLIEGDFKTQVKKIFENLAAVASAAGGSLENIVRVGIYLTDLSKFAEVNEIMEQYFSKPYPARSTIGVAALPKGATIEIDAIMVLPE